MKSLSQELREYLMSNGASLVGYADLSALPREVTQNFKYGISIAAALDKQVVLGIANGPTAAYYEEYVKLNHQLDTLDLLAADFLVKKGFKALPKVKSSVVDDGISYRTILPHKTVATRAGLGWIGKSALLVTKEYGSAVRLSTVLTNAELEIGIPIDESQCGSCDMCRKTCPAQAIRGLNWSVALDRDVFYNAPACREKAMELMSGIGIKETICGKCIQVCPWTNRYLRG